jgi:hypothetical protein
MPQRSRPSLTDRIFGWLQTIFTTKPVEETPQEVVLRSVQVRVENPGDRHNAVEEIQNPDKWSLATFRVRPITHTYKKQKQGTSAKPEKSVVGEAAYYFFVHKIPPSRRGKPVTFIAAGKRHTITDTSLEFGCHQVSVLRIPDKLNKATWFYVYRKGFRFDDTTGGDRAALRLAEIFAKQLVVSDLSKEFKFGDRIEKIVTANRLGTWKEKHDKEQVENPKFIG